MAVDPTAPLSTPSPGRVPDGPATQPRRPDPEPVAPAPETASAAPSASSGEATLWDLLTPDERVVLERHAGLGSLTYRSNGRPAEELPVPTGRHIDIRG